MASKSSNSQFKKISPSSKVLKNQAQVQRTQLGKLKAVGKTSKSPRQPFVDSDSKLSVDESDEQNARQNKQHLRTLLPIEPEQVMKKGVTQKAAYSGLELYDERIQKAKLLTDIFDLDKLKSSPNFAIKTFKDSYYIGETDPVKNIREGSGVCIYTNGRHYEGSWKADKRHGRGFERFTNGNTYLGQYELGKVCGKGVYTFTNQDVYDGEWLEGMKHGYGVWKNTESDSYIGQWFQNMAHGYGVHEWQNGDRYEGEWRNSLRHGQGSDIFANGDVFIGEYNYGQAQGYGQYRWSNGNTYSGTFVEGRKEGKGVWKKSNEEQSNKYEGDYVDDHKHGFGEFFWASGGHFSGQYQHDLKSGYGIMTWADSSTYIGLWKDGIQNGIGIMIFSNGVKKAGIFQNNVLTELLLDQKTINICEQMHGEFDEQFKRELQNFIAEMNPDEDQRDYLQKELKKNQIEERAMPNTLLNLQEAKNVPYGKGTDFTRSMYVKQVKSNDAQTQFDDKTGANPQEQQRNQQAQQQIQQMQQQQQRNLSSKKLRTIVPVEPPNEFIFHDFDYVGFDNGANTYDQGQNTIQERVGMIDRDYHFGKTKSHPKRKSKQVSPRQIKLKPLMNRINSRGIMLPEINFRVQKESRQARRSNSDEKRMTSRSRGKNKLINNALYTSKDLAGYDEINFKKSPRKAFASKKLSLDQILDSNIKKYDLGPIRTIESNRNQQKYKPSIVQSKRTLMAPRIDTIQGQQQMRSSRRASDNLNMYFKPQKASRNTHDFSQISRGSSSSKRNFMMKHFMQNRAWVPSGHPNSIGQNRLTGLSRTYLREENIY